MSPQPFQFYVDSYNMVGNSRKKASYRFSKENWESLMQYRQWETNDAMKTALEMPKIRLIKDISKDDRELQCLRCSYSDWWGGSAMTNYACAACGRTELWGSTAVPKLCGYCAFRQFKCMRCGESRDKDLE